MRTILIALLVAACGGPSKPTTPPPQLPEDKKPEPVAEAPKPAPPPKDPDPIDVPLQFGVATYKLTNPGKGQKSVIKIAGTTGTKQQLAFNIDFAGKQTASAALGGDVADVAPTLVLNSDVEVGDVTADASKFKVTFSGVDARDREGAKKKAAEFKDALQGLQGVTLAATVASNGQISDATLHVQKPVDTTLAALELVKVSLFPMWPIVPKEAVGVGAKWTVTAPGAVVGTIAADVVTDYEVVSHKGTAWVLKAKTKVDGKDQSIGPNQFKKIGGTGDADITLDTGFIPKATTKVANDFTAAAGDQTITFHLEQQLAVSDVGVVTPQPPLPAGITAPAANAPSNVPVNTPPPSKNQTPAGGATPTPSAPSKK